MKDKGIDVSENNGHINWEAIAPEIGFAMIRVGYGKGNIDGQFVRNISECNRLGIPCGAYWFSYAYSENMAKNEAEYCIEAVKPYVLSLPVAFDWEYDSRKYATEKGVTPTRDLASAMCRAFCEAVKAAGYTPSNYTNPDFLGRFYDDTTLKYPLWLAQWGSSITFYKPAADIWLWQYGIITLKGEDGQFDGNQLLKKETSKMTEVDEKYLDSEGRDNIPSDWAKEAVEWARSEGLIIGDGDGNLRLHSSLTREQLCVMLMRFSEKEG